MTDTSERDELARTIAMACGDDWDGRESPGDLGEYLDAADVLLAAGWSRVVPRPDVESDVEWRVETDQTEDDFGENEREARDWFARCKGNPGWAPARLVRRTVSRTVGPWQEVS